MRIDIEVCGFQSIDRHSIFATLNAQFEKLINLYQVLDVVRHMVIVEVCVQHRIS